MESGARNAIICTHWAEGGAGAVALADAVIAATEQNSNFKVLYDLEASIEEKINKIAKEMYGAGQVVFAEKVNKYFHAIRINYYHELLTFFVIRYRCRKKSKTIIS